MSAHTPGPWYVSKRNPLRVIESGPRGNTIAKMGENLGVSSDQQAHANARLIAAAPDLLEALDELLEHVEWRRRIAGETAGPRDVTHRARAALAKARGTP